MRAPRPAANLFSAERAAVCAEDFQFWPHSNFAPLTIGVYLEDVHPDSGPMKIVPLSHWNQLHPLEDENGQWTAVLPDDAVETIPTEAAVPLAGPAGTVTIHNCRCVHGSDPNTSRMSRHLLLQTFTPASAHTLDFGSNVAIRASKRGDKLVFGEERDPVWDDRAHPQSQEAPWMPKPEEGKPTVNFFRNAKDKRA